MSNWQADLKYSLFFFWFGLFGSTNVKAFRVGAEEFEDSDSDLEHEDSDLDSEPGDLVLDLLDLTTSLQFSQWIKSILFINATMLPVQQAVNYKSPSNLQMW